METCHVGEVLLGWGVHTQCGLLARLLLLLLRLGRCRGHLAVTMSISEAWAWIQGIKGRGVGRGRSRIENILCCAHLPCICARGHLVGLFLFCGAWLAIRCSASPTRRASMDVARRLGLGQLSSAHYYWLWAYVCSGCFRLSHCRIEVFSLSNRWTTLVLNDEHLLGHRRLPLFWGRPHRTIAMLRSGALACMLCRLRLPRHGFVRVAEKLTAQRHWLLGLLLLFSRSTDG